MKHRWVYLHVEIAARELDSKLWLATLAASRGYGVVVSDNPSLMELARKRLIPPGIYHTKSLSPGKKKLARHQELKERGFAVTSIDEEGGLVERDYQAFAKRRYSRESIGQADKVFCWGESDYHTLCRLFPDFKERFVLSGSPRADLWLSRYSGYWSVPKSLPKRPFVLISSNLSANHVQRFHERIRFDRDAGYLERDAKTLARRFGLEAETRMMTLEYIFAIGELAGRSRDFEIVLRPHPGEDIEAWRVFLQGIPNVSVLREGSVSQWVQNAFAVVHNSCTTAMEAYVSEVPVVTYVPFPQSHGAEIPNSIGIITNTAEDFADAVIECFETFSMHDAPTFAHRRNELVEKKLHITNDSSAAQNIVKTWDEIRLVSEEASEIASIWRLKFKLWWREILKRLKLLAVEGIRNYAHKGEENSKFPPLDEEEVRLKVIRAARALGIDNPLSCQLIGPRTVLIRSSDPIDR